MRDIPAKHAFGRLGPPLVGQPETLHAIRQSGDKYAGWKWLKIAATPIENMRATTKGSFPRRQRSDRAETVPFSPSETVEAC
jgi:hypothetical protein